MWTTTLIVIGSDEGNAEHEGADKQPADEKPSDERRSHMPVLSKEVVSDDVPRGQ